MARRGNYVWYFAGLGDATKMEKIQVPLHRILALGSLHEWTVLQIFRDGEYFWATISLEICFLSNTSKSILVGSILVSLWHMIRKSSASFP